MQLSVAHIQSIRSSWRYFRNVDTCILGDAFFTKLFTDHPALEYEFRRDLSVYYQNFHDFLNLVVARLDRAESVVAVIMDISNPHPFGTFHHQHLHKMEASLIWTLKKGMGSEWTTEIEEAWQTFYQSLVGMLRKSPAVPE